MSSRLRQQKIILVALAGICSVWYRNGKIMLITEPVRYLNKGAQEPVLGKEGEKEVEVMFTKRMRREAIV